MPTTLESLRVTQIDATGYQLSGELPAEVIRECSQPGDCHAATMRWAEELGLSVPPEGLRDYLRGYGAWDDEQLSDHDGNVVRLLWLICCDAMEEKAIYG